MTICKEEIKEIKETLKNPNLGDFERKMLESLLPPPDKCESCGNDKFILISPDTSACSKCGRGY